MSKPGPVWVKIECCDDCPVEYYGKCDVEANRTYPPADCPIRKEEHREIAELQAEVERLRNHKQVIIDTIKNVVCDRCESIIEEMIEWAGRHR